MNAVPNLGPTIGRTHSMRPIDTFADAARSSLFNQIGRSIGDDAANKLIADFGGRRLYIPMAPTPGDRVTSSIGLVAALAMARVFGGDRLFIPVTSDHARRRARILAMRADHVSIARIASQLRCTERHVYKVLALERGPRQAAGEGSAPHVSGIGNPRPRRIASPPALAAEHFKRGIITGR